MLKMAPFIPSGDGSAQAFSCIAIESYAYTGERGVTEAKIAKVWEI